MQQQEKQAQPVLAQNLYEERYNQETGQGIGDSAPEQGSPDRRPLERPASKAPSTEPPCDQKLPGALTAHNPDCIAQAMTGWPRCCQ